MAFFRKKPRLRQIGEVEAYDRSYGDRSPLVKIVKLPPRRPRYRDVLADGEKLRRAFQERLDNREKESDD
jgi:hypothetical protein